MIAGVAEGFLSATETLRIATMETPAFIFPDRNVGCLEIGCDASFIGFGANPAEDITSIRDITYRMKDGSPIDTKDS
ncbi:MAG: hypothetical protein AAGK23_11440 [Pseudomonadota bacterium]